MDINKIMQAQSDSGTSATPPSIPVPVKEEEEPRERRLSDDETAEIIKKYIQTGIIEREYSSPNGLYIGFRVPSQLVLMEVLKEGDKEILSNEDSMTYDQAQMIRSCNALAAYVAKIGDEDYTDMQGDEFDAPEGYRKRKELIYGLKGMNAFMMRWSLDKLTRFQEDIAEAFDAESLKNS